jgi:hypothetical protein
MHIHNYFFQWYVEQGNDAASSESSRVFGKGFGLDIVVYVN